MNRNFFLRAAAGAALGSALPATRAALQMDANDPRVPLTPGDPPRSWTDEARYLGYREADHKRPYASFFRPEPLPAQPHVAAALAQPAQPAAVGLDVRSLARELSKPGYLPLETGYSVLPDGKICLAVLTKMPRRAGQAAGGITGEMWDWWFGWHSKETQRYKLWHPGAHQYASLAEDRADDKTLSDRQKYINNISYVDEFVGAPLLKLAIRFVDPASLGFAPSRRGETVICGRGGSSEVGVMVSWLAHQVRQTDDGAEMRSRFIFNDIAAASNASLAVRLLTKTGALDGKARADATSVLALLQHCGTEMNHLASFLPELHAAFGKR